MIAVGSQIATAAMSAKIVDRIGKITSDRSLFRTPQLCFVSAQPREMRSSPQLRRSVTAERASVENRINAEPLTTIAGGVRSVNRARLH